MVTSVFDVEQLWVVLDRNKDLAFVMTEEQANAYAAMRGAFLGDVAHGWYTHDNERGVIDTGPYHVRPRQPKSAFYTEFFDDSPEVIPVRDALRILRRG